MHQYLSFAYKHIILVHQY
uniref:Uncharacterized protein n=1 Tax=Arundo donax TaxID=35708 RepID=A0A0A8ZC60_ARUDO